MPAIQAEPSHSQQFRVLIVTALAIEYEAIRSHLKGVKERTNRSGFVYDVGSVDGPGCVWNVAVFQIGRGNIDAAIATAEALEHVRPHVCMFVGIAGGVRSVSVGDVVAATKVYYYEGGKDSPEGFAGRPSLIESTPRMIQRAQSCARRNGWRELLDVASSTAKAVVEPIVAGERVVASTASETYSIIRSMYNDAVAVEMEGFGFGRTVARSIFSCDMLIVRGISDCLDGKADSDAGGGQIVASKNAAAFAIDVLRGLQLPSAEQSRPTTFTIQLEARIEDTSFRQVKDAVSELGRNLGDPAIRIVSIAPGSVNIELEASEATSDIIFTMWMTGKLSEFAGKPLLSITFDSESTHPGRVRDRRIEEIVSAISQNISIIAARQSSINDQMRRLSVRIEELEQTNNRVLLQIMNRRAESAGASLSRVVPGMFKYFEPESLGKANRAIRDISSVWTAFPGLRESFPNVTIGGLQYPLVVESTDPEKASTKE